MLCIGRSHGIHAEPTTFGLKFAFAYAEFKRCLKHMQTAKNEVSVCKISGPVGNYSNIDPKVEQYVAKKLGLKPEIISTQVIPRDRHAFYFSILALIASSIERLSTEIRHLQRTEVREVEESFTKGQKGSSAMPHKRNPVLSENLTGLSRYIRSLAFPAMENISLWHERDISHSSVERIIAPDATIAIDFSLKRLNTIIKNLIIYPSQMKTNLEKLLGLHHSQKILLELVEKGLSREKAYSVVQENAMKTWDQTNNTVNPKTFLFYLSSDSRISNLLDKKKLEKLFDDKSYTKHVKNIFSKVFK